MRTHVEILSGDGPDRVDVGLAAETGQAYVDAGAGHDVVLCFGDDIGWSCELTGGGVPVMTACEPIGVSQRECVRGERKRRAFSTGFRRHRVGWRLG